MYANARQASKVIDSGGSSKTTGLAEKLGGYMAESVGGIILERMTTMKID